jgi:hypothetical protein
MADPMPSSETRMARPFLARSQVGLDHVLELAVAEVRLRLDEMHPHGDDALDCVRLVGRDG